MNDRIVKYMIFFKRVFLIFIFLVGYRMLVLNYVTANICMQKNRYLLVCIIYFFCAAYIIYGKRISTHNHFVYKIFGTLFIVGYPVITFYSIEIMYNTELSKMQSDKIMINCILISVFTIGVFITFYNYKRALIIFSLCTWAFGLANHYLLLFKGNPLLPSELRAFQTAFHVVEEYDFTLTDELVNGSLITLLSICGIIALPFQIRIESLKKTTLKLLLGSTYFALFFSIIIHSSWDSKLGIMLNAWNSYSTYAENGSILSFILEEQAMRVDKPDGYSKKDMDTYLGSLDKTDDNKNNTNYLKPTVIVVMNESFSDLAALTAADTDECLADWYGIENYVMRGNAYTSVYGGGTCNSEFEFLTGNSMANFSQNSYPYVMYDFKHTFNIARILKNNGYRTIAIHPENKNNWNRARVYSQMGFQKFVSIDKMENMSWLRWFVSDWSNFDWIIKEYEENESPLFIFNVTMQNHGGYGDINSLGEVEAVRVNGEFQQYEDFITYLTLIRESDKAFRHLVDYFSNIDMPVIICMFGDHQPALNGNIVNTFSDDNAEDIETREKRYCVPYLIWSNYRGEILAQNIYKDISINYLGANILDLAGIDTPYTKYLLDLEGKIPIINHIGYMDNNQIWHNIEEQNEDIIQYKKMGYYMMFDYYTDDS